MSLLKVPRLGRRKARVRCHRVGAALVAHGPDGMTKQAGLLAASLPEDDACFHVVVDFPAGIPASSAWQAVAKAVAEDGRAVRLFPSAMADHIPLPSARWLSERVGHPVLCPDGPLSTGSSGAIFLPPENSQGWAFCAPGQPPVWQGRRYPIPEWEGPANLTPHRLQRSVSVEPLPAGLWIRADGPESWLSAGRAKLTRWLSASPRELTIVLGAHGVPALPLTSVVKWWETVSPDLRAKTRFFCFGDLSPASDVSSGQALADALGEEILLFGGFPVGKPEQAEVFALRHDGSHGHRIFAELVAYRPRHASEAAAVAPTVCRSRLPAGTSQGSAPGIHPLDSGAVVEVVQAGLWVRPLTEPAHAAEIRGTPADPEALLLFHEPAEAGLADRVLDQLEAKTRAATRKVSARTASEAPNGRNDLTLPMTSLPRLAQLLRLQSAADEKHSGSVREDDTAAVTTKIGHPAVEHRTAARAVLQQEPDPGARVWPLPEDFSAEQDMARPGLEAAFDALSLKVGAAMRRFSSHREVPESVLTAAVAAGLYLSGEAPDIDASLRAGAEGPHIGFGRCVADGLRKLPRHREATATVVDPGPEVWALLETGTVVREWGFFHARTVLGPVEAGATDLVVRSLTGRSTSSMESAEDGLTDRVVFLPGTSFKVLEAVAPEGERRGRLLIRELPAAEAGRVSDSDDVVLAALQAFAREGRRSAEPVSEAFSRHRGTVPGIADGRP
ncbi:hypothetical protein AB5J62_24205 [Amycolatopsis sp. cg5]|uniref:hypothetical protein n=1 Tax=Amycolatopsis sp. cg5 TaxID=3238802 RepID=UPI003523248B